MTRGPKPIPTQLKLLRGCPDKRPINDLEPQPDPAIPDCPEHLIGEARLEWYRMSLELFALRLLTKIDRAALAAYCMAYGRWHDAELILQKMNVVLVSKETGNMYPNPYFHVANKAMEQMHKFLIEFGMTPSSRSRIKVDWAERGNEFDRDISQHA